MMSTKDNYVFTGENEYFRFVISSELGDREEQQDASGYAVDADAGLIVLCDGMGGHRGGRLAGRTAVHSFLSAYSKLGAAKEINQLLVTAAESCDTEINALTDENGNQLRAGTTVIAAFLDKQALTWLSVGDSRLYIYRKSTLVPMTKDHNYEALLDFQLKAGEVTEAEYAEKIKNGSVLISFLGMGGLRCIDTNCSPFLLEKEDILLMTTDGLYKLLEEEQIGKILDNFSNIEDAATALRFKAARQANKKKLSRDNTTFSIIKIR